jgi:hypothetical protein
VPRFDFGHTCRAHTQGIIVIEQIFDYVDIFVIGVSQFFAVVYLIPELSHTSTVEPGGRAHNTTGFSVI